ncbi:hypothetical protein AB0J74_38800 [Asanoa sp. NPDC049573]|uniref:hypothetical protein n=1 Tax=Asanoa sp. NPDC049573 TaxID=3155396 RepID=UPI003420F30B
MDTTRWRVAARAFPGPVLLTLWAGATVTAPLVFFNATHRWEDDQPVSTAVCWTVGAAPALAAVVAARWTWHDGQRRTASAFALAVAAATLAGIAFVGVSLAVFRWVIPLGGAADWLRIAVSAVSLAACGAAVGYMIGLRLMPAGRLSGGRALVVGGVVAVLGAFFAQTAVQLGAEDSTVEPHPSQNYGGVGPFTSSALDPGLLALPAAGRYAIYAVGSANPADCEVTGSGLTARSAEAVAIPPADYGDDYATYAWVAFFDVPGSGTYTLTCQRNEQASYTVGEIPEIRGAVSGLIHWPLAVILVLGALPGLSFIADASRRAGGRRVS